MAKVTLPPFVDFIRGRVGDLVFKNINGQTFVSRVPRKVRVKPTKAQRDHRSRFREATGYACAVLANPAKRSFYAQLAASKKKTLFALAVGDFFHPPEITFLDLSRYDGKIGDNIVVQAMDDGVVVRVEVAIKDLTGKVLESGLAEATVSGWRYRSTTQPRAGYPLTIAATATDMPGNKTTKTAPWVPLGYVFSSKSTGRT